MDDDEWQGGVAGRLVSVGSKAQPRSFDEDFQRATRGGCDGGLLAPAERHGYGRPMASGNEELGKLLERIYTELRILNGTMQRIERQGNDLMERGDAEPRGGLGNSGAGKVLGGHLGGAEDEEQ